MDSGTPELIFTHIPKTAGISFLNALHDIYGEECCQQVWDLFPYELYHHGDYTHRIDSPLYQNRHEFMQLAGMVFSQPIKAKVLHGHMPLWAYDGYFPGVPRVVWLRDPADQILSRVFHFRKHDILGARDIPPEKLVEHPLFRNNQFWYTGSMISQFAFVGIVERYEIGMRNLARMMGWKNAPVYHYHPTGYEDDLRIRLRSDDGFVQKLREMNVHDFALYDHVAGP